MSKLLTQKELATELKCTVRSIRRLEKSGNVKRLYSKPLRYLYPLCMVKSENSVENRT